MTVWRQPEAPFICIRPIPLSCALRNSAFGLRVRVIFSRHTYKSHIGRELARANSRGPVVTSATVRENVVILSTGEPINNCEVIYEIFHILKCGCDIK